jgi:hypothetical protein
MRIKAHEYETAILDFVLAKAFSEETLDDMMRDLWDHASHVGYMDGYDARTEPEKEDTPHASVC